MRLKRNFYDAMAGDVSLLAGKVSGLYYASHGGLISPVLHEEICDSLLLYYSSRFWNT